MNFVSLSLQLNQFLPVDEYKCLASDLSDTSMPVTSISVISVRTL